MEKGIKRLIVLSSPSGGGKSTVARHLMKLYPNINFSVSATTRNKRPREKHGKDYYFLSKEDFLQKIKNNDLVEYEEIYGNFYGTLKSSIDQSLLHNITLLFDVDVKGALSLRENYPNDTLLIFLVPPNIEILRQRLLRRQTEEHEEIERRMARAEMELNEQDKFDYIIINENLQKTFKEIEKIAEKHIGPKREIV